MIRCTAYSRTRTDVAALASLIAKFRTETRSGPSSPAGALAGIACPNRERQSVSPRSPHATSNFTTPKSPIVESDPIRQVDNLLSSLNAPEIASPAAPRTSAQHIHAAGPSAGQDEKRMRSSIACSKCRRSKVKCVNKGVGTRCDACRNSGRECDYPANVATGRRPTPPLGRAEASGDSQRSQRPRKSTHTSLATIAAGPRESHRPLLDALDPKLLTVDVWKELYDIYQSHYSADFPFLHAESFKEPFSHAKAQANSTESSDPIRPPGSPEFLLAFLALTSRFHPDLIKHHSRGGSEKPLLAAEYYAAAANERLEKIWNDHRLWKIDVVQATLMVGLHEWGMCRGGKAWFNLGAAIRIAQAIGLHVEPNLDDAPMYRTVALNENVNYSVIAQRGTGHRASTTDRADRVDKDDADRFLQEEIRRRTFWSCFIMDRYLSSGKFRPQSLHARDFRIQLPASEQSFAFKDRVRTLMLGEEDRTGPDREAIQRAKSEGERNSPSPPRTLARPRGEHDKGPLEVGPDEGVVSLYVKVLELYGKVVRWSCSGGRRKEEHPPWDPRCEFYKLRQQCQEFKASLPPRQVLRESNLKGHIFGGSGSSTPYILIHVTYLLCQIFLHREYVPFIPIRCSKPMGPLDAPMFPPDKYTVPDRFWENSAAECFGAARDIMDLMSLCQSLCQNKNCVVETPIVGFALYIVAFVGVYCITFPEMDPNGYMCTAPSQKIKDPEGRSDGYKAAKRAVGMLQDMEPRLHMAAGWLKTIGKLASYLKRVKAEHQKALRVLSCASSEKDGELLNRIPEGGGLDEYNVFERALTDFGTIFSDDVEMADAPHTDRKGSYDDSNNSTTDVKSEEGDYRAPPRTSAASEPVKAEGTPGGAWSAVNRAPQSNPTSRHQSISTPANNGAFRSYESYGQSGQPPPQSQAYPPSVSGFRPAYSADTPNSAGAPPSLLSPSVATASPAYERRDSYSTTGAWASGPTTPYSSMPPPQQHHSYPNGGSTQLPPISSSAYHTQQHLPPPPQVPQQQPSQPNAYQQQYEQFFQGLTTASVGGYDVVAFTNGDSLPECHEGWPHDVWHVTWPPDFSVLTT